MAPLATIFGLTLDVRASGCSGGGDAAAAGSGSLMAPGSPKLLSEELVRFMPKTLRPNDEPSLCSLRRDGDTGGRVVGCSLGGEGYGSYRKKSAVRTFRERDSGCGMLD